MGRDRYKGIEELCRLCGMEKKEGVTLYDETPNSKKILNLILMWISNKVSKL